MLEPLTAIKKPAGIEDFINSQTSGRLETVRKAVVHGENVFSELMIKYKRFLDEDLGINDDKIQTFVTGRNEVIEVLTSEQINMFLQATIKYEEHKNYKSHTGVFI